MTQVNIRMDDVLKNRADALFKELGLNMTTAITMFIRQAVRQGAIPFEVAIKEDPFYTESNMRVLRKAIQDANEGKLTAHELIED
ncbi:MAG: type II toxin-antitoxin system RelB/DinJ family antitoxin [Clostridia bacterium]|nr:type II toxin-antitoxin system RelB/DinJ family antitoxin [Clostridia bacterium]